MNFEKLKNFMDYMAQERTPGNAVEVYLGGKCVFRYASGYADLQSRMPMTGEEYFNFYSCSKLTTVVAGLQLLERGKFLLTDPLYEYIPEFRDMYIRTGEGELVRAANPITVRDLFTMSAGFTYDMDTPGFRAARELTGGRMDTAQVVRCIARDPLAYEPGTHWGYSIGHDVLAGLISIIEGMKFRDYVNEYIFKPLDIRHCVYHQTPEIQEKMAVQYSFVPEGEGAGYDIVEAQKHGNAVKGTFVDVGKEISHVPGPEYDSGGAGITGTISDYVKLMAALANHGLGINGRRILSRGSVALLKSDQLNEVQKRDFNWRQLTGYSYGLGVRTLTDKALAGSVGNMGEFGWGGAAGSTALVDTEAGLAVFYAQHTLNPREEFYQPRLRNVVYSCLD